MLNIFREAKKDKADTFRVNYSLEATLAEYGDRKIHQMALEQITDRIVKDWIEAFGDDLLEKITPEEVEKAVKKNLAERVLKA